MTSKIEQAGKLYAEMVYPTMSEEHKTLLSFGMLDVSIAHSASDYFKDIVLDSCSKHYSLVKDYLRDKLNTPEYRAMESEFQKGLYVQLLLLHKKEGLMVC